MGCCSNRPKPFQTPIPESIKIESISTDPEYLTLIIHDFHLTKNSERILKNPNSFSLVIKTPNQHHETSQLYNSGLHYSFPTPPEIFLEIPLTRLTISLLGHKFSNNTQLAEADIELDKIDQCGSFKKCTNLWYRCSKICTVSFELYKLEKNQEYLTIGEVCASSTGQFLPGNIYPKKDVSNFSPTPKFNTLTDSEVNEGVYVSKVDIYQGTTSDFDALIQGLDEKSPEVIYYVLDRLVFFACQSIYSDQINLEKILGILKENYSDSLIIKKALWLLFCLIENSKLILENFQDKEIDFLVNSLYVSNNKECLIIGTEILIKYCDRENCVSKIAAGLMDLSVKAFPDSSPDLISGILIIVQKIMSINGKSDYWHILLSNRILNHLDTYVSLYILNNEIMLSCLKIILAFSLSKKFTKDVAAAVSPSNILNIKNFYIDDKAKLKAVSQILSKTLPYAQEDDHISVIHGLIKILQKNINSKDIAKAVIKCLSHYINHHKYSLNNITTEKCIEFYISFLSSASLEQPEFESFIFFIHSLGKKSARVKEQVWKDEAVQNSLEVILLNNHVSSTGSSSQLLNSNLIEVLSEILSME